MAFFQIYMVCVRNTRSTSVWKSNSSLDLNVEDLRLFFNIGQLATMAEEADAHSYFRFVRFANGFLHL